MNIAGINYESINDGEGVRTVIYVSGCSHKCKGCHNPQTHDVNYGVEFTNEFQNDIINNIEKRPFISGITLSGGDPLHDNNVEDVYSLITNLKSKFPNKNIWLYTGYKFNFIMDNPLRDINTTLRKRIVETCDVIVDGPFIEELKDLTLKFRGSSNQRLIDVQKTLQQNSIVLYDTKLKEE